MVVQKDTANLRKNQHGNKKKNIIGCIQVHTVHTYVTQTYTVQTDVTYSYLENLGTFV